MNRPWLNNIDKSKRILEIGPLCWPNVKKEPGVNVYYSDIKTTEEVKEHYKNHPIPIDQIVNIDFLIGEEGYSASLKDIKKFDYVIATHVIEHIPQLIMFFHDISGILNNQGKLCLTIPDKRFCFDRLRYPTSFAECYDIYMRKIKDLPFRVLDHLISSTKNDPVYWWNEASNFKYMPCEKATIDSAKEMYLQALKGEYYDVHFSVFTPESFLLLLLNMLEFNLLPFRCIEFDNTEINTFEFNCVLELSTNILVEGSAESKNEKENIIKLLNENQDSRYSNLIIENLKNDLQKSNEINDNLKNDLKAIQSSKSWKITAPLRKIRSVFK